MVNDEVRRLNDRTYQLTATVSDGRCTGTTTIKIMSTKILLDLYRFSEPYYYFPIGEEQKVPFLINRFRNVGGFPAKYYLLETFDEFNLNATTGNFLISFEGVFKYNTLTLGEHTAIIRKRHPEYDRLNRLYGCY